LVKTSGHIANFDDEDATYHKSKYAKEKGLGGVMVWEVGGDTPDAKLAQSIVSGFKTDSTPPLGKNCLHIYK
jgi:GH18 family chitinase